MNPEPTTVQKLNAVQLLELLRVRHHEDVFVPECKDGMSGHTFARMDAWAMKKAYTRPVSWAYEIKVSRNDFMRDDKWPQYLRCCNQLYFVCPTGLISPEEVPEEAGLLWASKTGTKLYTKKKAPHRAVELPQDLFRYVLFSRAKITAPSWGGPEPTTREQWAEWLKKRQEDRILGMDISKALRETIAARITEAEIKVSHAERLMKEYDGLRRVIEDLGFDPEMPPSEWNIKRKLNSLGTSVPDDLEDALYRASDGIDRLSDALAKLKEIGIDV